MKKQRRGQQMQRVTPKTVKQHQWKAEAKKEHPLSPGGPRNRRKIRSRPTKMNSFRSGPS